MTTLKRKTRLKAHKGLTRRKRLAPVSDKQKTKNTLWDKITDERCYELGFMCQWCHRPGQRNDPSRFWDFLDGHHIEKRRYNIHTKKNCYIAHRLCHDFIEDNSIDVREYPDKEAWEQRN